MAAFNVDRQQIRQAYLKFRALGHPLRIRILSYIHSNGEIHVTKIYRVLRLDQPVASQQLKILRDAQLVLKRRDGKRIYYSVNYKNVEELKKISRELLK